jgi:acyl-CoA synthetase (AMP-forming)/AMP-acid ligase II
MGLEGMAQFPHATTTPKMVFHTLADVLAAHASTLPAAPLLIAPEAKRTLTYADLKRQTEQLARFLQARGHQPGAKVGLFLHNGYQTTTLFLASMCAGYVVTPFNLLAQRSGLAAVVRHSEVGMVFTSAAQAATLTEALADVADAPEVVVIDVDAAEVLDMAGLPPLKTAHTARRSDPALLMYTSGTTGTPKGVLLNHANLLAAANTVAAWHGLTPQDRVLSSLPLYHINGQVIATLAPFVSGGSIVNPHRFSVSQWWDLVAEHQCTWINIVPTIIAYLLNAPVVATRKFPSVRFGRSASAPLPPEHHQAFEARFGIPVIEAMGMTECASMVFCNPQNAPRKYGSPGLPCGVEVAVINPQGQFLPANEPGEIVLRGANVMAGYYQDADKTAEAIKPLGDGAPWLHSGDLGYRDADGFYFITGRLKELIIKGGENIAPREIDETLLRHPDVLEAAAFGIPHPAYGQDIAVAVIAKPGCTLDEAALKAWCVAELGPFKTPSRWLLADELPKGPSGKVQRLKLAELVGE